MQSEKEKCAASGGSSCSPSEILRSAPPLAVFCDFDGTFSVQDVGSTLARRYAADRRPAQWARLERGELTPWEYNMEILNGLSVSEQDLEAFLQTVELDPGAHALVSWCEKHGIPFLILSDGFDRNLDRLQEIHEIAFDYLCNHLEYENGIWKIAPTGLNPHECDCGTGNCKRGRIRRFVERNPGVRTVHIGNGRVSDTCGAEEANFAFAKGTLADELTHRGVAFHEFETLHDVVRILEDKLRESNGL